MHLALVFLLFWAIHLREYAEVTSHNQKIKNVLNTLSLKSKIIYLEEEFAPAKMLHVKVTGTRNSFSLWQW